MTPGATGARNRESASHGRAAERRRSRAHLVDAYRIGGIVTRRYQSVGENRWTVGVASPILINTPCARSPSPRASLSSSLADDENADAVVSCRTVTRSVGKCSVFTARTNVRETGRFESRPLLIRARERRSPPSKSNRTCAAAAASAADTVAPNKRLVCTRFLCPRVSTGTEQTRQFRTRTYPIDVCSRPNTLRRTCCGLFKSSVPVSSSSP